MRELGAYKIVIQGDDEGRIASQLALRHGVLFHALPICRDTCRASPSRASARTSPASLD